jgi:hypothetical protein
MAIAQNQTHVIGATQFTINALGASVFPTLFQSGPNSMGGMIQLVTGASTFIMPNTIAGASIAGATAGMAGWLLSTATPWQWTGPAKFFISTTSATAVIAAQIFYGAGATMQ